MSKTRAAMKAGKRGRTDVPSRAELWTYMRQQARLMQILAERLQKQEARSVQSSVLMKILIEKGVVSEEEMKETIERLTEEALAQAEAQIEGRVDSPIEEVVAQITEADLGRIGESDSEENHQDASGEGLVG